MSPQGREQAAATIRGYANDWAHFLSWCRAGDANGFPYGALPASPATLITYLNAQAGSLRASSLRRRCASISAAHRNAGLVNPAIDPGVRKALEAIAEAHPEEPSKKRPLEAADLRRLLDALPADGVKAARDRCLLLFGFYGALRSQELLGLNIGDVIVADFGVLLQIRPAPGSPRDRGREVALLHTGMRDSCPAESYRAWQRRLAEALPDQPEDVAAPAFRAIDAAGNPFGGRPKPSALTAVIKRAAVAAGYDDDVFDSRSLRSGFAISAAAVGKSAQTIMEQTGWKYLPDGVQARLRQRDLVTDNATAGLSL